MGTVEASRVLAAALDVFMSSLRSIYVCHVSRRDPCSRSLDACARACPMQVESRGQFMVLINPELINMGTTGYGLAGRRIRDEIISTFHTSYHLRTLPWGAVTRQGRPGG